MSYHNQEYTEHLAKHQVKQPWNCDYCYKEWTGLEKVKEVKLPRGTTAAPIPPHQRFGYNN